MKKPSLEEVKEYFKDAEKCKDWKKEKFTVELDKIKETDKGYVQNPHDRNWGVLYLEEKGYAKILTYKEPKEETFVITKEQIDVLCGKNEVIHELMREWFPSAFVEDKKELVLEVGKWYFVERPKVVFDDKVKALIFYEEKDNLYGFDHGGKWMDRYGNPSIDKYVFELATPEEIKVALTKEAVKRGLIPENTKIIKCLCGYGWKEDDIKTDELGFFEYEKHCDKLWIIEGSYLDTCIYSKGKWAEIIQTITKK